MDLNEPRFGREPGAGGKLTGFDLFAENVRELEVAGPVCVVIHDSGHAMHVRDDLQPVALYPCLYRLGDHADGRLLWSHHAGGGLPGGAASSACGRTPSTRCG